MAYQSPKVQTLGSKNVTKSSSVKPDSTYYSETDVWLDYEWLAIVGVAVVAVVIPDPDG